MQTKVETIAVVEYDEADPKYLKTVTTFENTPEGKTEAQTHFRQCAIENGATEDEVDEFVEDEYYETGTYQLFLK